MATTNEYLKSLMSAIPDIDKANPFEVQRGLDYELVKMGGEVTNETVKKALNKAVKNVLSDANYYTHLLEDATYELLGMKKPNRKKEVTNTEMEEVKKKDNMAPNQMIKAKIVKESLEEKKKNPSDFVIMDVPLFIRMLEYAREDAKSDMDLHDVAEKLIKLSASGKPVTMKSYDSIVSKTSEEKPKSKSKTEPKAEPEKSLDEKKNSKPDFLDLDGDGDKTEPMKKAAKDKKKSSKMIKEDIDVGHEDDEPDMLKATVYRIGEYAAELYKMLDMYDKMDSEVDFPDWWQEKIHLAADYMDKTKHYLEFETDQPALDGSIDIMMTETFKSFVGKLKKKGFSGKAAMKIAGKIANLKRMGHGKGPTAKQKARMDEDTNENKVFGPGQFNIPMSADPDAKKLAKVLYGTDDKETVDSKIKYAKGEAEKTIKSKKPGAVVYEFTDEPKGVKYAAVMRLTYQFYDSNFNPLDHTKLGLKEMSKSVELTKENLDLIKKMVKEIAIDVQNPNMLTPQQKQALINKARQVTRKPKVGTAEDPVEFI